MYFNIDLIQAQLIYDSSHKHQLSVWSFDKIFLKKILRLSAICNLRTQWDITRRTEKSSSEFGENRVWVVEHFEGHIHNSEADLSFFSSHYDRPSLHRNLYFSRKKYIFDIRPKTDVNYVTLAPTMQNGPWPMARVKYLFPLLAKCRSSTVLEHEGKRGRGGVRYRI